MPTIKFDDFLKEPIKKIQKFKSQIWKESANLESAIVIWLIEAAGLTQRDLAEKIWCPLNPQLQE